MPRTTAQPLHLGDGTNRKLWPASIQKKNRIFKFSFGKIKFLSYSYFLLLVNETENSTFLEDFFCNNPVIFFLHVQYKAEKEEPTLTTPPGCWEAALQGAGAPAHAPFSLTKPSFTNPPVPDGPDRDAVFPHQVPHGTAIPLHDLPGVFAEGEDSRRGFSGAAEPAQGSGTSPALIHQLQVIPPTSTPLNSEGRQLSHLEARVTPFFLIYKIRCLHYLQARRDY